MSKQRNNAALAKGAEAIRKAEAAVPSKARKEAQVKQCRSRLLQHDRSLAIPTSTRPIEDIIKEHVTILPGHIGLEVSDDIPLEEHLRVLDWTTQMSDHVGFMIGDVLNNAECRWGKKYTAALERTGRAYNTLRHYASVARRIPVEQRKDELSFSAHREALTCGDGATVEKVLNEAAERAEQGDAPTIKELRSRVKRLKQPASGLEPEPKHVTSGNDKRNEAQNLPPAAELETIPNEPQVDEAPEGWTPPPLEWSDLTDDERDLFKRLIDRPELRLERLMGSICHGTLLKAARESEQRATAC